jgi:predicted XRE-type DNA-binding protein
MDEKKMELLKEKGWQIGSVVDFLGLTPEEAAYIELKLILADNVRQQRQNKQLTQMEIAKLLESSQSRVAKMEAGDPSVSLDLLIRALLSLGATKADLAQMLMQQGATASEKNNGRNGTILKDDEPVVS